MKLNQISVAELGLTAKQQAELERLGINSIEDLLTYFPYRYEDYRLSDLSRAEHNERVTVQGTVMSQPSLRWYGKKKSRLTVQVQVGNALIRVIWFNQFYLKKKLYKGAVIALSGRWNAQRREVIAERTFLTEKARQQYLGSFTPVYSITQSIKMDWLRRLIYRAFVQYGTQIEEILPQTYLKRYRLMPRARAMYYLHFPKGKQEQHQARRRMVYEELFLYECKIFWLKKKKQTNMQGISHSFSREKIESFIQTLPFPLTEAQQRVVQEILQDLEKPNQMYRLLQGDVGSGKTVVAAIALYANFLSGYQGALMVPTEILADQHAASLKALFSSQDICVKVLTGSLRSRERREILEQIRSGVVDVVVGTHALIQEPVSFHHLGLIITDEQHRFGVKQRAALREKGLQPDVLFMSATPIPRTLAITAFGEMDISTIDQLPKGRKPVQTYWVRKGHWSKVVDRIRKECEKGFQAYVICPLIEESEKVDLQNAIEIYEQLTTTCAPLRVGLLHGKMNAAEKEEVMKLFAQNVVQILVSTTVVEVGVNVPNATMMVIYDADRFGLAQLHQLRGRVGRGQNPSTCVLIADPKTEEGVERMRIMTESNDGFEIARKDLQLRGPGDFLGVKQSGLPDFKVADLSSDIKVLEIARLDAMEWIHQIHTADGHSAHPLVSLLEKSTMASTFD